MQWVGSMGFRGAATRRSHGRIKSIGRDMLGTEPPNRRLHETAESVGASEKSK